MVNIIRVQITTKKDGEYVKPHIEFIDKGIVDSGFWDGFTGGGKDDDYFGIDCKKGEEQIKARWILTDRIKRNRDKIKACKKEIDEFEELLNTLV